MIRSQYHGRKTPDGFLVWDVRKLIEKADHLPVVTVSIVDIKELDEAYWYDNNDQMPTCRHIGDHFKLMQDASLDYPILLCAEGRVMDGMHRVVKAYCSGLIKISAKKFPVTPKPDFIGVSVDDLTYDD